MPRAKETTNGPVAANLAAVEILVAAIEEQQDGIRPVDAPLVERARSLAMAVDRNPSDVALAQQYGSALTALRSEVLQHGSDRFSELLWHLKTGCDRDGHFCEIYCAQCVYDWVTSDDGLGVAMTGPGILQDIIKGWSRRERGTL